MKALIDENLPSSLSRELVGCECDHVAHMGWRGVKNGNLLDLAEKAGFDILLTLDDDMRLEQNMTGRRIAILVIKPAGQGKGPLRAMAQRLLTALGAIQPGQILSVAHDD